ncbi:MAG: methyltransferase domain-containing protein [Actinomycetota bacterium]|nr:methyltransferase domain-containing protein [Actinomycetota bacterium]
MSDEVLEFWDGEAARFDDAADHGLRDPRVRAAWRDLLLPQLPSAPARILDVGCGTGTLSVLLASEGYAVTGLDLAPQMVAAARVKAAAAGVEVTFEQGDAADPAGEPEAYDVVLSRHLLWALPDPGRAVGRWVRLLRPGGHLVLVEGRWWTGGGLTATQTEAVVKPLVASLTTTPLADPTLWGGPIDDERYLVVASI